MNRATKIEKLLKHIKNNESNAKIASFFAYYFDKSDREEFRKTCWQNTDTYKDVEWTLLMALYWKYPYKNNNKTS